MPVHTGLATIKCGFCPRLFKFDSTRSVHQRSHTGERPFVCWICGHKTPCYTTLKHHIGTHRCDQFQFVCSREYCNKRFLGQEGLDRHILGHGIVEKPFVCPAPCSDVFEEEIEFYKHQAKEHGIFPLKSHYPGGINLGKEERQLCSYLTEKGVAFRQQVCVEHDLIDCVKKRSRIDFWIETDEKLFIFECNELQHKSSGYPIHGESVRPMQIFTSLALGCGNQKPVVYLYFNPHPFKIGD